MISYCGYFNKDNTRNFKTRILNENNIYFRKLDDTRINIQYVKFTNFRSKYSSTDFKGKKFSYVGIFIQENSNTYYNLILECEHKNLNELYRLIEILLQNYSRENILDCLKMSTFTSDITKLIKREV